MADSIKVRAIFKFKGTNNDEVNIQLLFITKDIFVLNNQSTK